MYDVSFFCFVFLTVKEEDDNHNISAWAITVDPATIWFLFLFLDNFVNFISQTLSCCNQVLL